MTASSWLALLATEAAVLTAVFLLHPATDWLLLTIVPIVLPTAFFGFLAIRLDDIRSRFIAGAISPFGVLWLGAEFWPVAKALGYLPRAAPVTGVGYFLSGRSARQFWPNPPWTRNCSATIFELDPNTARQWSGDGAEARIEAAAFREPRLWSGSGELHRWISQHDPNYLSSPTLLKMYRMTQSGLCGSDFSEWDIGYSGNMVFSELPGAVVLIDPHPRYPKAMVVLSPEL